MEGAWWGKGVGRGQRGVPTSMASAGEGFMISEAAWHSGWEHGHESHG